jgi:hypothetical protein
MVLHDCVKQCKKCDEHVRYIYIYIYIYMHVCAQQQYKCKKFKRVNFNDLHLHGICMSYIQLLVFTCTTSVNTMD